MTASRLVLVKVPVSPCWSCQRSDGQSHQEYESSLSSNALFPIPAVRRSLSSQSWVAAWTRTCSYLPLRLRTNGSRTSGKGGGRRLGLSRSSHPSVSHCKTRPAGLPSTDSVSAALQQLSTQAKIAGNVSLP